MLRAFILAAAFVAGLLTVSPSMALPVEPQCYVWGHGCVRPD